MEQVFNEPIIAHFFQSIKPNDKLSTLKELILLGIYAVSSKIHGNSCCGCSVHSGIGLGNANVKNNPKCNNHYCREVLTEANQNSFNNNLAFEIQKINKKIDQLAANFNTNQRDQNINAFDNEGRNNRSSLKKSPSRPQKQRELEEQNFKSRQNGQYFRHHLDDSQVRRALINPYARDEPNKKETKDQTDRNHQLQKQIDEQELRKNKYRPISVDNQIDQEEDEENSQVYGSRKVQQSNVNFKTTQRQEGKKSKRTGFDRSAEDYNGSFGRQKASTSQMTKSKNKTTGNVRSKIKSLIQKDKRKSRSNAFLKKSQKAETNYCQFQYSDEEAFQEEVKQQERSQQKSASKNCPVHPSAKKQNSQQQSASQPYQSESKAQEDSSNVKNFKQIYKKASRRMKENSQSENFEEQSESQSDAVSESSSFSKFSMSSRREAGKIAGLRK